MEAVNKATEATDSIREEYDATKAAHDLKVKTLSDGDAADKTDQIKAAEAAWEAARKKLNERFAAAKKTFDTANAEWNKLRDTDVDGRKLGAILDEFWKADRLRRDLIKEIMGPYETMTAGDQEAFDEKVGINRSRQRAHGSDVPRAAP